MLKFLTHIIYADRHKLYFILFVYLQEELENGEDVARCPSCSLIVRVIYDLVSYFNFFVHFCVKINLIFLTMSCLQTKVEKEKFLML